MRPSERLLENNECIACNGTGKLGKDVSPTIYFLAYKHRILASEKTPQEVKNLIEPVIDKLLVDVDRLRSLIELAYRRGRGDSGSL